MLTRRALLGRIGAATGIILLGQRGLAGADVPKMGARFDRVQELHPLIADGPFTSWSDDVVSAWIEATIVQGTSAASGASESYRHGAQEWYAALTSVHGELVPGRAVAHGVIHAKTTSGGKAELYRWSMPVVLR